MNDEDWMKKRSWRKGSGCSFVVLFTIMAPVIYATISTLG